MNLRLILLLTALLSIFSCNGTSPTVPSAPQLTATTSTVEAAKGFEGWFGIYGGTGRLRITTPPDSAIATVSFSGSPEYYRGTYYQNFRVIARELGATSVTISDSTGNAKITLPVVVRAMAFDNNGMNIMEGSTGYQTVKGGADPLTVSGALTDGFASYRIEGRNLWVTALAAGETMVTVRDNASPANTATMRITVLKKPVHTTPGSVSFSSTAGDFIADGVYMVDESGTLNEQGAGGMLQGEDGFIVMCEIVAYRKKANGLMDAAFLTFTRREFKAGTLGISVRDEIPDSATVMFYFNASPNKAADRQELTSGSMTVTSFTKTEASGTFSGQGRLKKDGAAGTPGSLQVTNGSFSVPVIPDDFGSAVPASEEEQQVRAVFDKLFNRANRRR